MPAHDGTLLDALFFAAFSPVTGDPSTSLVGLIDVSDRVKAQEMLAKVQAEIAHAARVSVLGELTASIAHEVSQPLTAIESNTEASLLWLARSPPNLDEVQKLSSRTVAEVQRAAGIIERIRSMAVRAAPEKTHVALNPLIDEAILFLRHELQRHGVRVALDFEPSLPEIFGDRVQLQQVIVNLAINAIQAMTSAASPEREIAIRTSSTPGEPVLIEFKDTGPGISDEVVGRLFDSFFTTKAAGMGHRPDHLPLHHRGPWRTYRRRQPRGPARRALRRHVARAAASGPRLRRIGGLARQLFLHNTRSPASIASRRRRADFPSITVAYFV